SYMFVFTNVLTYDIIKSEKRKTIINKKEAKKKNKPRKNKTKVPNPPYLGERIHRAGGPTGVDKTDGRNKANEDFVLRVEREKVMNEINQYIKYVKFGNVLREKLGEQAGVHAIQLSDALNINNTVDFLQKLIRLCINYRLQIPIMPTDPEFTEKAQAILLGMAGME